MAATHTAAAAEPTVLITAATLAPGAAVGIGAWVGAWVGAGVGTAHPFGSMQMHMSSLDL